MRYQLKHKQRPSPYILVVDDQQSMRESLMLVLEAAGFRVADAPGGNAALALLQHESFDAALIDLKMDDMDGIELLQKMRHADLTLPAIMITAYGSIESAVEAMRVGAVDYVTKPYDQEALVWKLQQALLHEPAQVEAPGPGDSARKEPVPYIVRTPMMRRLLSKATQAARTDLNILITGETGTGKSLLAKFIHEHSARSDAPFVNINCASLPEQLLESELFGHVRGSFTGAMKDRAGLFEAADSGTIFLDEISCLSANLQAKLLGVLQDSVMRRVGSNLERRIDVRVVAATSADAPTGDCQVMNLRDDLYYRLNGVRVHIPPLRDRVDDIVALAHAFLIAHASRYQRKLTSFSDDSLSILCSYGFPGNVRQLEMLMEQVVAFADADTEMVTVADLPDELLEPQEQVRARRPLPESSESAVTLATQEWAAILRALEDNDHNLTQAAKQLGIGRTTLWRKIKRYGLE